MAEESVLGIKVAADGVSEAAQEINKLTDDLKGMEKQTAELGDAVKRMGEANETALQQSANAMSALQGAQGELWRSVDQQTAQLGAAADKQIAHIEETVRRVAQANAEAQKAAADTIAQLTDEEKALWAERQKMIVQTDTLQTSIRETTETTSDQRAEFRALSEEFDALGDDIEDANKKIESFQQIEETLGGAIDALKDLGSAAIESFKALEDARDKLEFFQDSSAKTQETIRYIAKAAAEWGISATKLTAASTELAKGSLDVERTLEGVVKAAVASGNELEKTAETFAKAATGEKKALETLKEDYKLNLDALEKYGFKLQESGKIAADTEEKQRRLASALAEIARVQYDSAIAEQSESISGAMERLEATLDNIKSTFGEVMAPVVVSLNNFLSSLANSFNELDPGIKKIITDTTVLVGGFAVAAVATSKLITGGLALAETFKGLLAMLAAADVAEEIHASVTGTAATATEGLAVAEGKATVATETLTVAEGKATGAAEGLAIANTQAAGAVKGAAAGAESASKGFGTMIGPIGIATTLLAGLTYEMIKLYEAEQIAAQQRLKIDSTAQVEYYKQVRSINEELRKTGKRWDEIHKATKKDELLQALKDVKKETVDWNKALEATQNQISSVKGQLKELDQSKQGQEGVKSWIEETMKPLFQLAAGPLGESLVKEITGFFFGFSDIEDKIQQKTEELVNLKKEANAAAELANKQNEEAAALAEKEKEFKKQAKEEEKQRLDAQKQRNAAIKEELAAVKDKAQGLEPTAAGISALKDIIADYEQIGQAHAKTITSQKELLKEYHKGAAALDNQLEKLEQQKKLNDEKAHTEKIITQMTAQRAELNGKSYAEQKEGIEQLIARYQELLQTDAAIRDNAQSRKQVESELTKLTAERLSLEEKIANLQRTAAEKLAAAQEKAQENTIKRLEAEKAHAEKMGDTKTAETLGRQIDVENAKLYKMQNAAADKKTRAELEKLIKDAAGTPAEKTLKQALSQSLANNREEYNQKIEAQAMRQREEAKAAVDAQKQAIEKATDAQTVETTATVKTAQSITTLGTAAEKTAARLNSGTGQTAPSAQAKAGAGTSSAADTQPAGIDMHKPAEPLPGFGVKAPQEYTIPYAATKELFSKNSWVLPSVGTPQTWQQIQDRSKHTETRTNNYTVNINAVKGGAQTVDEQRLIDLASKVADDKFKAEYEANSIFNN